MKDGRLNLATLAMPSDKQEAVEKQSSSGYKIRLGKVIADLEARYDAPDQHGARATPTLRGARQASAATAKIDAGLDALDVADARSRCARR